MKKAIKSRRAAIIQKISPLPRMILFQLIYKIFIALVVLPLFRFILDITLTVSGYQLAFNDFILGFLLTIPGIIAAMLLLILASLCTYIEFAVLITYSGYGLQGTLPRFRFLARETGKTLKNLLHPSTLAFCVYILGLLPIVGMGLTSSLLPAISIPNFVIGELMKNSWGPYVLLLFALLVIVLFLLTLFTLPVMMLQQLSFGKAFVKGFHFTRHCGKKLAGIYLGFTLVWSMLYVLPRLLFTHLLSTPEVSVTKIFSVFGFSLSTIVLILLLAVFSLIQMILLPLLVHFIVGRYNTLGGQVHLPEIPEKEKFPRLTRKKLAALNPRRIPRKVRWASAVISLVLLGYGVLLIFNNPPGLHPPIVIGHRGSAYGVENTLEAIQGAIDAKADYAEVDILLSADGVPMVVHDANLNRLANQNINVYDYPAELLQTFTMEQNGFSGRISTLEEVVQFCRGKIGLTVEIKRHGHEQEDVIEKTMDVLKRYDFLEECIFISLEYTLVEEINIRYPEAVAGYCVYGNVGNLKPGVLMDMMIDFVVIEESMVSKSNLNDFRGAWLPVYVWTVNGEGSMRRYLELGAIGIVTDYPDLGKAVVDEYDRTTDTAYLDEDEWRD